MHKEQKPRATPLGFFITFPYNQPPDPLIMAIIEPRALPDDHYSFNLHDLKTLIVAIERFAESKQVMHAEDAAAFLGISERTLNRLIGSLPSHKLEGIGRVWLKSELIDYIKRH